MRSIFLFFFLFYGTIVSGQETKMVTHFKHLEVKNGLPENDVKGFLADDQNGYWFRTTNYIVYYNGHDFISYGRDKGLFSLDIKNIHSFNIQKNFLYVFSSGSVDKINCITKKPESIFKDKSGIGIKAGFVTRKGHLLLVFKNGDIVQLIGNKAKKFYKMQMFAFCEIAETEHGDILISNVNKEVAIFSSQLQKLNHVYLPDPIILNGEMNSYKGLGTLLGANRRILKYNPTLHNFELLNIKHEPGRLFLYGEGQTYMVSGFNKVIQYDEKTNRFIDLKISLSYNYSINKLTFDKNKIIVFCTNQGVILYKPPHAFVSYPQPEALNNPEFNTTRRAILETADKKILFISYRHLDEYDPVTGITKPFVPDKVDGYAGYILGNDLWVGSDGTGMYKINLRLRRAKGGYSFLQYSNEKAMHITSINKYNDSSLLLGLSGSACNLKLYYPKRDAYEDFQLFNWKQKRLADKVSAIINDSSFQWICSTVGLFQLLRNDVKLYIGKNELGTNEVNYVYPIGDSVLWIATDIGIIKYNRKTNKVVKQITENDGLAGNKCLSLLPDHYNTVWVPTYTGLSRVHLGTGEIWNYYMQDGFTDNEYNYASFLKASSGDIYLGGLNGFVRIRPTPPISAEEKTLSVNLDHVVLHKKNGEELQDFSTLKSLKMHESDDRLSIYFSIKEHLSPEYVRYYYKIDGLHQDWIKLDRQNKIDLAFIPSGNYSLLVKSTVLENKNEVYQFVMPLQVTNYWYETKVFYLIMSLIVVFLIIGIIYNKYTSVRELEKIRTDLANDIHDEIGTMLTRSIMRLELLKRKKTIDVESVSKVEKQLRNTVQSFRNVLWSLNTDNVRTDDFVGRLNVLLEDLFEGTNFDFLITNLSPDVHFKKSIQVKRNLLLIVKELAHNAIKHSNGDFFEVVIRHSGSNWKILIADNGKNDNLDLLQTGIGISSVTKRVTSSNGSIDIEKKKNGFFVTIYI